MDVTRRGFLQMSGAAVAGLTLGGAAGFSIKPIEAYARSLKIREADVVPGLCPYCAVGCGELIYVEGGRIVDIEGDPDNPHSLGRLCPKGAATVQLSINERRPTKGLYRAPGTGRWEERPLDWMMERIARLYGEARDKTFVETEDGVTVNRCEGIASLGSACIDNEECYLLSKLNRSLGIVYHEHQARV